MSGYGEGNTNNERRYAIHVAARLVGIPPRTLRRYERLGLLDGDFGVTRRARRQPFYSDADLERLRLVNRLIRDLGVNLAGAEVILHMRARMLELHRDLERLQRELEHPQP